MSKLTPKQEQFCINVVNGMSYKDSYINAYNCDSIQAAYVEGSKLAIKPEIQEKIKTLQKPIEQAFQSKAISDREKQIEFIDQRIELCKLKEDENNIRMYMDMKNKLLGLYKDNDDKQDNDNNLTNLDTSILSKIAKIS